MATIGYNGMQEISRFDPNRYGGLKDLNLYIDYHTNNSNSNYKNNGIFQVGNTYYFVTTGSNASLTKSKALDIIKNYGVHDNRHQTGAKVYKITDPTIIQNIQANASESRSSRMKLGIVDQGAKNIQLETPSIVNQFTNDKGQVVTTYSNGNVTVSESNAQNQAPQQEQEQNTEFQPTNTGGSSGYNPYASVIQQQNKTINELKKQVEEANRVYTGEELADHYGIRDTLFSRDYWNNIYTNAVNEMYDDLINQQNEYRSRFARNNSTYDDYLEKEYINSYNNASNARATRGAIAANALSTGNVNDYNSSKNDTSMLQNIYGYEALRQAGLADVANRAEQAANNNRAVLMQLGAKHNTSDVTAATNRLNAAATVYGADKNYLSGLAAAANTKYGGLVNAASANANSAFQNWYNYYMGLYDNNKDLASTYLTNYTGVDTGGNK